MTQRQNTAQKKARALTKADGRVRYTDALAQFSTPPCRPVKTVPASGDLYQLAVSLQKLAEAQRQTAARMMAPVIKAQNQRLTELVPALRVQAFDVARMMAPVIEQQRKYAGFVAAQQKLAARMMEPFFAAQGQALVKGLGPHISRLARSADISD
ncbi:hypothetical protein [Streptomyces sp. YS-3]|uniref:hypothetical protein n=1 Tax=Streptomyces sp. YS-3 TaxID=3381352 RepID=UPI003862BC08